MRFTWATLLVVSIFPLAAAAQAPAPTVAELARSNQVESGDDLMITFALREGSAPQRFRASLLDVGASTIRVELGADLAALGTDLSTEEGPASGWRGAPTVVVEIPSERVLRIAKVDGKTNGIVIGAALGAGSIGIAVGAYCLKDEDGCVNGGKTAAGVIAAGAAIGAGFGLLFDLSHDGEGRVLFRAPGAERVVTYAFAPMLSRQRKGAQFVIGW